MKEILGTSLVIFCFVIISIFSNLLYPQQRNVTNDDFHSDEDNRYRLKPLTFHVGSLGSHYSPNINQG